jgi:hypothetical protein
MITPTRLGEWVLVDGATGLQWFFLHGPSKKPLRTASSRSSLPLLTPTL